MDDLVAKTLVLQGCLFVVHVLLLRYSRLRSRALVGGSKILVLLFPRIVYRRGSEY
jgi:hypothetical protein